MEPEGTREVTRYLRQLRAGESSVVERLLPFVHGDLQALARQAFRGQRPEHTLQPTALVNEAYLRLVGAEDHGYESRKHFLSVAAMAMRQILADHARRRAADKRPNPRKRVLLEEVTPAEEAGDVDLVALDLALDKLQQVDPRQARIVELRYLAGMSCEEVADLLGIAPRTVRLDWQMARAWLRREIDAQLES